MWQGSAVTVNILIKEEEGLCVAHCLELDIVATAESVEEVERDIVNLVKAQISYAFSNDNLDYLYHPAPAEVWREFFACKESQQERYQVTEEEKTVEDLSSFVPPWIIANTCKAAKACHV